MRYWPSFRYVYVFSIEKKKTAYKFFAFVELRPGWLAKYNREFRKIA